MGAAVGLEALGGAVLDGGGDGLLYIVVSHVEELLETVAASLMLLAALSAVHVRRLPSGEIRIAAAQKPVPEHGRAQRVPRVRPARSRGRRLRRQDLPQVGSRGPLEPDHSEHPHIGPRMVVGPTD